MFGDNFLIAPIYKDNPVNEVTLPDGRWRYFFNDSNIIEGPATFEQEFQLDEYPVYIREGAIIPMDIKRQYTGIGDRTSEGYLTVLIYPGGINEFTLHHPDKSGSVKIQVEDSPDEIKIDLDGLHKPHILVINMDSKPLSVEMDGNILSDHKFDPLRNKLVIKTAEYKTGHYVISKR
jgi:alpha-glucosidase (family GH31 glycosyl hydrolase)